uniref:Uncharacterized protein n=1 Tax=Lygus hesperus TaxID=30085 RepID=A0A0A9YJY0_LYGHE
MNMLDLATYLPKLGRLTASLAAAADEGSKTACVHNRGKKGPSKQNKKEVAVMLIKKPIVTSHPNAYRSSHWTRSPSPTKRQKRPTTSITLPKARKAPQHQRKAKTSRPTSRPPEKLIKPVGQSSELDDTRDIRLMQQALEEFREQRDQFVQSLSGLQRKLLKFRVPNLFGSTVSVAKSPDKPKPTSAPIERKSNEKPTEKPEVKHREKKSRSKEVRSVSQHFYLADMTESESTSSSSSSASDGSQGGDVSEIELARRKVNKFLDYDLIPIEPPDTRRLDKTNSLFNHQVPTQSRKASKKSPKPGSGKPLNAQLTQLRRGVSEMVKWMPSKTEAGKQKTAVDSTQRNVESSPKTEGSWSHPLSPKTRAAVTSEFKRLKKASEMKLRNKLQKL